MTAPAKLSFSHLGIYVRDLPRMRDFYTRLLGFVVTDEGGLGQGDLVFMSRDPDEHHQLVLAAGRPADLAFNVVNQISLRTESLADLRAFHAAAAAEPDVTDLVSVDHGIAWSIYFRDPEGNRIEIFVDSPWYVNQPMRVPIDLERDDAAIMAETEARIRDEPSFGPRAAWRAGMVRKLAGD